MRVLLVGAAGFLGRFVERGLVDRAYEVWSLDQVSQPAWSVTPHSRWVESDIRETDWRQFSGFDAVICLASSLARGRSKSDWVENLNVNVIALRRLIDWAVETASVRSFVFTSSAGMYARESGHRQITEASSLSLPAPYWTTKLLMEQLLFSDEHMQDLRPWVLRLSSPYGPGQPAVSVLPRFVEQAKAGLPLRILDGGYRAQDFIWVEDAAEAHIRCLEAALPSAMGPINLGSGEEITMRYLAETVNSVFSSAGGSILDVPTDNPDTTCFRLDIDRLRSSLCLTPRTLREGLERWAQWAH